MQASAHSELHKSSKIHYNYTTIQGFFLQSEPDTDSSKFDFTKHNFGLIGREYDTDHPGHSGQEQWARFERYVRHLNKHSEDGVSYKVIFLGRHGQGWHNVAESKYGTTAWDCYWSMLEGADGIVWADANLTALGQTQAVDVHNLWKSLLPRGIPVPAAFYVSPLSRAIETADLTFKTLQLPGGKRYSPVVKELLREAIGVHTCDRRRTASQIKAAFPHVKFENGFSEDDLLWKADVRETTLARTFRLAQLLDDVFEHDDGVFLSFTAHSGAISNLLRAIGHRSFHLGTGAVIPVFVRGKKKQGQRAKPPQEPSHGAPACPSSPPGGLAN